jgi:hypothetical protein
MWVAPLAMTGLTPGAHEIAHRFMHSVGVFLAGVRRIAF